MAVLVRKTSDSSWSFIGCGFRSSRYFAASEKALFSVLQSIPRASPNYGNAYTAPTMRINCSCQLENRVVA